MVVIGYEHDGVLTLGALAGNKPSVQATKIDASRLNGFRLAKLRIAASVVGKTATEGPIAWGIACNLDADQIESIIEADPQASVEDDDHGAGEWIKTLGLIPLKAVEEPLTGPSGAVAAMDDHKVNWSIIEGKDFTVWAYNMQSTALTTGTLIHFFCEFFGVWLRD